MISCFNRFSLFSLITSLYEYIFVKTCAINFILRIRKTRALHCHLSICIWSAESFWTLRNHGVTTCVLISTFHFVAYLLPVSCFLSKQGYIVVRLFKCWANVADAGQTLIQQWVYVFRWELFWWLIMPCVTLWNAQKQITFRALTSHRLNIYIYEKYTY